MTIKPKFSKKYPTKFPVGATITITEKDAAELAAILSYAVNSDSCGRMLYRLAAACEALQHENEVYLQDRRGENKKLDAVYDETRQLFDADYGNYGGSE